MQNKVLKFNFFLTLLISTNVNYIFCTLAKNQ
jgi:hypothetical protein